MFKTLKSQRLLKNFLKSISRNHNNVFYTFFSLYSYENCHPNVKRDNFHSLHMNHRYIHIYIYIYESSQPFKNN